METMDQLAEQPQNQLTIEDFQRQLGVMVVQIMTYVKIVDRLKSKIAELENVKEFPRKVAD
jgi:hypothetical protein